MKKKKLEFIEDENGCFITTSHVLNKDGYCNMWHNNMMRRAHRHIYEECFGEIRNGLVVRHKCDVRNCVNPEHMVLGTPKENVQDAVDRGRRAVGEKSRVNTITSRKAREIKSMIKDGKRNYEITHSLKVSSGIVSKIRSNKTWKHVDL